MNVNTERPIHHATREHLCIVDVINKVERLINELKLPPKDAYHNLRHTIEAINTQVISASLTVEMFKSLILHLEMFVLPVPVLDGLSLCNPLPSCMSSSMVFHLMPINLLLVFGETITLILIPEFQEKKPASGVERSFVQFVLDPFYKIYSQVIGEHKKSGEANLAELGVTLSKAAYQLKVRPLLRLACSSVFGTATGFTDMLVHHIPSAKAASTRTVEDIYTGLKDSTIYQAMEDCDPHGSLMVNVTKLYPKSYCSVFDALGRVYSGKLMTGQTLRVFGESY